MVDFTACEEEYRKACDKYRSRSFNPKPDATVVKRRWRTFLIVEVVLLTCFVLLFIFRRTFDFVPTVLGVLGTWLAFTLPVAFLYLIGRPPAMTLDPDNESPETRAMAREVGRRAAVSDDEFHSRFYEPSAIAKETTAGIRRVLRKRIDPDADRLVPTDYLPLLWDGLDFADLFYAVGQEFDITLDRGTFNGTLDSLIRLVCAQLEIEARLVNGSNART